MVPPQLKSSLTPTPPATTKAPSVVVDDAVVSDMVTIPVDTVTPVSTTVTPPLTLSPPDAIVVNPAAVTVNCDVPATLASMSGNPLVSVESK
ncbi:hypothetical protein ON010_g10824 [Phytophthora cinnamomi]|nr:hypothetical protein ON010_g10824 [Phytophthora cinnamomi]